MSNQIFKIRLKKGDMVIVRSGKYKGKTGRITAVHPELNKVTVEGINIAKKHQKPTTKNPQGGIIDITRPIWVSKVGLYDATTKKATRISYLTDKAGVKKRVAKTSGKELK